MSPPFFALLALSDGSVFYGNSKGYNGTIDKIAEPVVGEVVFNTAMTGYQEILTDPSYHSQIINFTHPHIGNTGIVEGGGSDNESDDIFVKGMVARQISTHCSNWRSTCSLPEFLQGKEIIAIDGVDTRAITRLLRDKGALGGCLSVYQNEKQEKATKEALEKAKGFYDKGLLNNALLANKVSRDLSEDWKGGRWNAECNRYKISENNSRRHVVVLDCGAKKNILRALVQRGCRVTVLPYDSDINAVMKLKPQGVLFSNGPGDPAPCDTAIALAKALLDKKVPLFGLCLGHQIIAAALGATTEKMKFGHHGANHPVLSERDGRVLITSQNHGFAVGRESLPKNITPTHKSLFDGSLQGFCGDNPPLISFQGHPEASPGPHDAASLFDDFICLIDNAQAR